MKIGWLQEQLQCFPWTNTIFYFGPKHLCQVRLDHLEQMVVLFFRRLCFSGCYVYKNRRVKHANIVWYWIIGRLCNSYKKNVAIPLKCSRSPPIRGISSGWMLLENMGRDLGNYAPKGKLERNSWKVLSEFGSEYKNCEKQQTNRPSKTSSVPFLTLYLQYLNFGWPFS